MLLIIHNYIHLKLKIWVLIVNYLTQYTFIKSATKQLKQRSLVPYYTAKDTKSHMKVIPLNNTANNLTLL